MLEMNLTSSSPVFSVPSAVVAVFVVAVWEIQVQAFFCVSGVVQTPVVQMFMRGDAGKNPTLGLQFLTWDSLYNTLNIPSSCGLQAALPPINGFTIKCTL